jgi:hypothetical protein
MITCRFRKVSHDYVIDNQDKETLMIPNIAPGECNGSEMNCVKGII